MQEKFEGQRGEAFWSNKPVKPTYSRRSMIQARAESIRKGHVNKFQATGEAERRTAMAGPGLEEEQPHSRRLSWGSTSSVRRQKVSNQH